MNTMESQQAIQFQSTDANSASQQGEKEWKETASILCLSKDLLLQAKQSPSFSTPSSLSPSYGLNLTKLDLFQADLDETSFPSFLPSYLPNLQILFCMKNNFTIIPPILAAFPKLSMISFKSNKLTSIHPEALGPQLQWLILTDNQLTTLPSTIGRCTKLQKLMLSGNQISTLPKEIGKCTNLELVRLSSNKLSQPPMDLLKLPNLSWIALSENPFLNHLTDDDNGAGSSLSSPSLKVLPYDELDDPAKGEILGKGASGITRKYKIPQQHHQEREEEAQGYVAVKEFYSNITSDGNPLIERRISLTTATQIQSKSLIHVIGQTKKGNLVMELLSNYEVLANPPSLQSCSRDVYDHYHHHSHDNNATSSTSNKQDMKSYVTYKRMTTLVHYLLYTLKELHTKCSITHGDFYGHNILFSTLDESQIWLTDFGAAFFYDRSAEYGKLIELIERRAFCHLLTEVQGLMDMHLERDGDNYDVEEEQLVKFHNVVKGMIDSKEECTFEQLYEQWSSFYDYCI